MKKIKLILSFFIMTICLSYLSSCISKEAEPKIYMFNPKIDFSSINFDIKVIEPEEILIKEIYIKLYNNNQLESTLSSKDGLHRVGASEDIEFNALLSETEYRIDFSFDYFVGKHMLEDEVIYSYSFKTTENNTGVTGEILNWSLGDPSLDVIYENVKFDAIFKDENSIVTDVNVYLKRGNETAYRIGMKDGLKIGPNYNCEIGPLPPNSDYEVILCATFTYEGQQYIDLPLTKKEFRTDNLYDLIPFAELKDISVIGDVVVFDLQITDYFQILTGVSVVLTDLKDNIISELTMADGIRIGSANKGCRFSKLLPNTSYNIRVLADYKILQENFENIVLTETEIKTGLFDIEPIASISNIIIKDDVVTFVYIIIDRYN
ncbi:MAG: hypothetical protein K2J85_04795, partial [Anaeroplasmataceae bacterium]|nr:hypothetical protein [Anaeroplasmataceae bacterium]